MVNVYLIEKDKYGEYFIAYGKKRRVKTFINKKGVFRDKNYIIFKEEV